MKLYKNLSAKEKEKLVNLLKEEDFKYIKDHGSYLSFSKGMRNFELYSTDYEDHEDGLRVSFDFYEFLKEHYEEKTRHSVSLQDAIEAQGSIEDACEDLEWNIKRVENVLNHDSKWKADVFSEAIYEVEVNGIMHLILIEPKNNEENFEESQYVVYAGPFEPLISMGTKSAKEALPSSKLFSLIEALS